MEVLLPCVRRAKRSDNSASPLDVKFGIGPGNLGTIEGALAIAEMAAMAIFAPELFFFIPFISVGWEWAFEQLGFGATHIEIQKKQIQSYLTPMFKIANGYYGFPLADDHALNFESSGVRREFRRRPDLGVLATAMWTDADSIITGAFGYDRSGPGIRQRLVNQFLANAAYNDWPVQAAMDLWHGIVLASTCPKPPRDKPADPPPPEIPPAPQPVGYQPPKWQQTWDVGPISAFPWADQSSEIRFVPPEFWPYAWPEDGKAIWEITKAPAGAKFPEGTLFVMGRRPDQYAILPNGETVCFYPPIEGQPDPPDVGDPPPVGDAPDLSIPLAQLRRDFELLRADYQQFKQVVFQEFDSLKDVIWRTNIRGNFQAAEVYAADQPAWQGPRPAALQPPMPPAWQSLPTPGVPQVLELPPIQEFPQAPGQAPIDLTAIQQELDNLQEEERQILLEIERVREQLLFDIGQAIIKYDREVEKPDLQKLRDECCTPKGPLTPEQRARICEEGKLKWGIMAECWLNANTPEIAPEQVRFVDSLVGQDFTTHLRAALSPAPGGHWSDAIRGYADKIKAGLLSGTMPGPEPPPFLADADLSYVYEKAPVT